MGSRNEEYEGTGFVTGKRANLQAVPETGRFFETNFPRLISIVSMSSFERDCLAESLRHAFPDSDIRTFADEDVWKVDVGGRKERQIVLYSLGAANLSSEDTRQRLRDFVGRAGEQCRVIVLAQSEDTASLFDALECGAAGFIPPSVGLEDLVETMRVSSSRSVLVSRKSMLALRRAVTAQQTRTESGLERCFTDRQLDVARALQKGAANKTIAYELNLCESTVKVHIRNIMRKLNATNRTQAAFKLNQIANGTLKPDIQVQSD